MKKTWAVFTFREAGVWVAAWERYDMLHQGETEDEAIHALFRLIGANCVLNSTVGVDPFHGHEPNEAAVTRWRAAHLAEHPTKKESEHV